jgi:hypothetical protein
MLLVFAVASVSHNLALVGVDRNLALVGVDHSLALAEVDRNLALAEVDHKLALVRVAMADTRLASLESFLGFSLPCIANLVKP